MKVEVLYKVHDFVGSSGNRVATYVVDISETRNSNGQKVFCLNNDKVKCLVSWVDRDELCEITPEGKESFLKSIGDCGE